MRKKCTKCGEEKGLEAFSKDRVPQDGLRHSCKSCNKKYYVEHKIAIGVASKRWRSENKEKRSQNAKIYYIKNKEKIDARNKQYGIDHAEELLIYREGHKKEFAAQQRVYRSNNRAKRNASHAKRRALKLNATPSNANLDNINAFYAQAQRLTKCLGTPFHVDHIIPLVKGGEHAELNLQVIPAAENLSKGDKMPDEFYK